jgi:molecular chaperone GrpE
MMEKETMENMQSNEQDSTVGQGGTVDISSGPDDSQPDADQDRDDEVQKLRSEVAELKEKFLRQVAEFDNFRKRNARERIELIQTAGKDVIVSLLDVLDDSERAQAEINKQGESNQVIEGINLVFNKLRNLLHSKGLKPMESIGQPFNADLHEAVTEIPVPSEDMKGKVVDELQKGYYLNDKIIRFAKVVVGK